LRATFKAEHAQTGKNLQYYKTFPTCLRLGERAAIPGLFQALAVILFVACLVFSRLRSALFILHPFFAMPMQFFSGVRFGGFQRSLWLFGALLLGGSMLPGSTVFGQSYVLASDVPVLGAGGQPLVHAWAGGLNNPQFSNMDVNGDGLQDLFVFDRQGDVPLVFLGDGVGGAEGWRLSPVDALRFPVLRDWAYLRDVNCDGIEDLVTSRQMGIAVYQGARDGGLRFLVDTARLPYVQSGFLRYVGVTEIDIPALEDVDGDGDRDVLTFNLSGGYVEWFVNRASENGDPCGPIDLEFADGCWGRFYESGLAKAVDLDTCGAAFTRVPP
jgi:hypothetical protein